MRFKLFLKMLAITAIVVLGTLLAAYGYLGGFTKISLHEKEVGPFYFVYREIEGTDYSKIEKVTSELHAYLTSRRINNFRPLDIYYPAGSRPNEIGFTIPADQSSRLDKTKAKFKIIARSVYITTSFPFKNPMSFFVGYLKVNPALADYRATKKYSSAAAITINEGDHITYLQPVVKH